jgi:Prolyl oligopeptidase family
MELRRALVLGTPLVAIWPAAGCMRGPAKVVAVRNPVDGHVQQCTWHSPSQAGGCLVVSLPTWNGSFEQADPLLQHCIDNGWAYLRPNLRGPQNSPQACLSEMVLSDLHQALQMADANAGPFKLRVLVGESGGGYTALGAWVRMHDQFQAVLAWNPISDLERWYAQTAARYPAFAADILACTNSGPVLQSRLAEARSPVHWLKNLPRDTAAATTTPTAPLELFAGLHDGHAGSVSIEQSLLFFRAVEIRRAPAKALNLSDHTTEQLLNRQPLPDSGAAAIAGRRVYFKAASGAVHLSVFDGAHEHLIGHTVSRIHAYAGATR